MREYDELADWYAADRTHLTGVPEVADFAASLPAHSLVVDIGCGNGLPLTRTLLDAGHRVIGLDSSQQMLARFRTNLRAVPCVLGLAQSSPFRDGAFDAAISWGTIFHLTLAEQARAFANVSRILRRGSPFLFTAGDVEGGDEPHMGTMNGVTLNYFSHGVDSYRRVLREHDFDLRDVHKDGGGNTYYATRKVG